MTSSCHIGVNDNDKTDLERKHSKTTLHARSINKIFNVL